MSTTHEVPWLLLTDTPTGRAIAFGLVVPTAGYCALTTRGQPGIVRQDTSSIAWDAVAAEIKTVTYGLLPPASALSQVFASGRPDVSVRVLSVVLVGVERPADTAAHLDALLLEMSANWERQQLTAN